MGLFGKEERPAPKPQTPARRQEVAPPQVRPAGRDMTVIAKGATFDGTLTGASDVQIDGTFQGQIRISGRLTIADTGKIKAQLHGKVVIVAGHVKGDVTADERIELKEAATLTGDITAPRILIREGATFDGQVHMKTPTKPQPPATQKSAKNQPPRAS
ncbi:MAG: polymer-forming cytoskeletal protein [Acidobacteria bacterium]|nr:polymer-forming cytoskeletal protein [Acidobacteriota bacterium]